MATISDFSDIPASTAGQTFHLAAPKLWKRWFVFMASTFRFTSRSPVCHYRRTDNVFSRCLGFPPTVCFLFQMVQLFNNLSRPLQSAAPFSHEFLSCNSQPETTRALSWEFWRLSNTCSRTLNIRANATIIFYCHNVLINTWQSYLVVKLSDAVQTEKLLADINSFSFNILSFLTAEIAYAHINIPE